MNFMDERKQAGQEEVWKKIQPPKTPPMTNDLLSSTRSFLMFQEPHKRAPLVGTEPLRNTLFGVTLHIKAITNLKIKFWYNILQDGFLPQVKVELTNLGLDSVD